MGICNCRQGFEDAGGILMEDYQTGAGLRTNEVVEDFTEPCTKEAEVFTEMFTKEVEFFVEPSMEDIISEEPEIKELTSLCSEDPTNAMDTIHKIQALVRGYFSRQSFKRSVVSASFQSFYETLPQFYSSEVSNFSYFSKNGLYEGEVDENEVPNGLGKLTEKNCIREGIWANGKLNGLCRVVKNTSEVFVGMFKDGVKEGFGEYFEDSCYKGQYKNDLYHGNGKETWKDGSSYEGIYKRGVRTGQGTFTWADGSRYVGSFWNNKIQGFGEYFSATGDVYKGEWTDNLMHGKGKFVWADGKVYEGHYKKNKKNGFGILIINSDKRYEGHWKSGKPHGEGTLYTEGSAKLGIWFQGKYIS